MPNSVRLVRFVSSTKRTDSARKRFAHILLANVAQRDNRAAIFGAPIASRAADLPVYVYPDVSPSARAAEVIQVLKNFTARLPNYEGSETVALSVIPFFEDAFTAAPMAQVRIPGSRPVSCLAADTESDIAKLSKSWFHYVWDGERKLYWNRGKKNLRNLAAAANRGNLIHMQGKGEVQ
jgi:hypothetical protein